MELNINSPAYFSEQYGVDDFVYRYCQNVYQYFKNKNYSETLKIIGIIPIAAPKEAYESGKWKERVRLLANNTCASISLQLNFKKYYNSDSDDKVKMMCNLVLCAVKKVKSKGKFDYSAFEKDFISFTESFLNQ